MEPQGRLQHAPRPAFVSPVPVFGGAEQNLLRLMAEQRRTGILPAVVVSHRGGPLAERCRAAGVPVTEFSLHSWERRAPWRYARSLAELAAAFLRSRANLVHVNHEYALAYAVRAARLVGRPSVVHVRGVRRLGWPAGDVRALAAATAIVAVSGAVRDSLLASGVPADRIEVIYDGVVGPAPVPAGDREAVRASLGAVPGVPLVGAVARLVPEKGLDVLLRALAALAPRVPGLRGVVVGTGPEEHARSLVALARDLGLGERVVFAGFREDVSSVLRALDVLVLPTHDRRGDWEEACPNVVLEAMACGAPVVATHSGGTVELLADERGLLVPPGDAQALADAVVRVLSMDDRERAAILARARRAVETEFSITRQAEQVRRLYHRALA